MKTSIICILDRSGSMHSIMEEAIGSINSFIKGQKNMEGEADVTVYAFSDVTKTVRDKVDVREFKDIEWSEVQPSGMTGLYDAVGRAILRSNNEKTIVLIQTDGEENASQKFNKVSMKEMISVKESMGWEFHFIGAGIDAMKAGAEYGFRADRSVTLAKSADGMDQMERHFSNVTACYRSV